MFWGQRWSRGRALSAGIITLLTAAGCGGSDTADTSAGTTSLSTADAATTLRRDVAKAWPHTGDIWPGVNFGDHVLLLTDGKTAWAITAKSKNKVAIDDLTEANVRAPGPGGYGFATWQGHPAVIVGMPEEPTDERSWDHTGVTATDPALPLFDLATRVSFRHYVQTGKSEGWGSLRKPAKSKGAEDGANAASYPVKARPRMYRVMVYNALLDAYRDPAHRKRHLSAAAYWWSKWSTGRSDARASLARTDLSEGTAQYFSGVADAMTAVQNPTDAAQRRDYFARTLKPLKRSDRHLSGRAIGLVAGLNADEMNRSWKAPLQKAGAQAPAAMVLRGVTPTAQTMPGVVKKAISAQTAERNKKLSAVMTFFTGGMKDKRRWVLLVPTSAAVGGVDNTGFFTTSQPPMTISPRMSGRFRLRTGDLTLTGRTVGRTAMNGMEYVSVLLDPKGTKVSLSGTTLELTSPSATGTFTVAIDDDTGRRVLIAQ